MQCGDTGKKGPGTHRLVFINGVLDTPAALRDPGRVKHWDRWHSKYWRGQGEVYTGRRDLLVDIEEWGKMEEKLETVEGKGQHRLP